MRPTFVGGENNRIKITESNRSLYNGLNFLQKEAVWNRDYLLARKYGLTFDQYMILVDP